MRYVAEFRNHRHQQAGVGGRVKARASPSKERRKRIAPGRQVLSNIS